MPAPPSPHDVVTARVAGVAPTGLEKLEASLYKAKERSVVFNSDPAAGIHRLAAGTAGDGLVVRAGPQADFPAPLAVAPNPMSMTFDRQGASSTGHPLRVDFYATRVGR